jgi:NADPH:quinone reductase-like Zn-dependent oxidoreductase
MPAAGRTVAAVMGEMGRAFDGGYAEHALLPDRMLMPLTTTLPRDVLAALPESYLTAQGSLDALGIGHGDQLLIRGGTSSVGTAASIAAACGAEVAAMTRSAAKAGTLEAEHVVVYDGGPPAAKVHEVWPDGPDHVLDLIGASTTVDSLRLVRRGGTVCVSGSLSGWLISNFEPIAMIPSATRLRAFHSEDAEGRAQVLQRVEAGVYRANVDRGIDLDDIVAAHRYMEATGPPAKSSCCLEFRWRGGVTDGVRRNRRRGRGPAGLRRRRRADPAGLRRRGAGTRGDRAGVGP